MSDDILATECAPTAEEYENQCYILVKNGTVERGCFYDGSIDVRNECNNYYSESCSLCPNSNCNRAEISAEFSFNGVKQLRLRGLSWQMPNDHHINKRSTKKKGKNKKNKKSVNDAVSSDGSGSSTGQTSNTGEATGKSPSQTINESNKIEFDANDENVQGRSASKEITTEISDKVNKEENVVTSEDINSNVVSDDKKTASEEAAVKDDAEESTQKPSEESKNVKMIERSCYQCDSRKNPNCTNQLEDEMIVKCPSDAEDLGCYHMITGITFLIHTFP